MLLLLFLSWITLPRIYLFFHFINLLILPAILMNSLYIVFISFSIPHSILIFTDGSAGSNLQVFLFFIHEINISFSDQLYPFASFFTAKCYAIVGALKFILSINVNDIMTRNLAFLLLHLTLLVPPYHPFS